MLVVLEEHRAGVTPVAADHPGTLVRATAGGGHPAQPVQCGPVIPEPADLYPSRIVDLDVVGGQQLVVKLGARDLQGEPALGHGRGEQRVRAVVADRVPARAVLAELAVLPDRDNPGSDQVLDLSQRQHGIALGVGAAVGHVHSPEARQLLEQQRLDRAENSLASLLVGRAHDPGRDDVRADHPLDLDQMMVPVDRPVVGGDGLDREERQARDLVAGQLSYHGLGDAGVGPGHVLAPVGPHRQRRHHIAQQHRHVHRLLRDQRDPERDQRVRVAVQCEAEVRLDRLAE
jgi:hypothetical protein